MSLQFFRLFTLIICISVAFPFQAQVKDDFSDGEFLSNPAWAGDRDKFTVRQYDTDYYLLDLNDVEKGNAVLSTPSTLLHGTEWNFHFQLNGKTRNKSSYARFYLTADSPDLRGAVNGYFVDFGSMDGLVALVRQDGSPSQTTILAHSKAQMTLSNTSNLEMRITCSSEGKWTLYADIGNGIYSNWGSATDKTHQVSKYTGIYCVYTKTNCANFSFGGISVKPLHGSTTEEEDQKEEENEESPPEEENEPDIPDEETAEEDEGEKESPGKESATLPSGETGFYLERRSFTPDGDGIKDEIPISYNLPEEGYEAQLTVYNASGRKIRKLEPLLLPTAAADIVSSELKWDGKGEDGETATAGLYILTVESTHTTAPGKKVRLVVALTF